MSELMWLGKEKHRCTSSVCDVTISKNKDAKGRKRSSIRFRNSCFLRITKNNYVVIAMTGARIYFKQSNPTEGYSLSMASSDGKSKTIKMTRDLSKHIGDYELFWDSEHELNYIDLNKKLN
jgi:hypothetical protein